MLYGYKFEKDINEITDYICELKLKRYHDYVDVLFFDKYLERIDSKLVKEILYNMYKKNIDL